MSSPQDPQQPPAAPQFVRVGPAPTAPPPGAAWPGYAPQAGPYPPYGYVAYPPLAPPAPKRSIATRTIAWLVAAAVLLLGAAGVGLATRGSGGLAIDGTGQFVPAAPGGSGGSNGSGGAASGSAASGGTSSSITTATEAQTVGIVHITTVLGYQGAAAAGTGLVLSSDGEILTNNHVISGATKITVTVASTGEQYTAKVVGAAPTMDVAVLQLEGASDLQTVKTDDSDGVQVGDEVTGVGNAGGKGGTPSASPGEVTALDQTITATDESGSGAETLHNLIQTNADIEAGDSGGALYDADNEVIGINTAAASQQNGATTATPEAYAIPINDALALAKQIESGQETSTVKIGYPAFLGIAVSPQSGAGGATVAAVVPDSPAAQAGIVAGDVVTAVNGQAVDSTSLTTVLGGLEPGDQATVTWTDANGQSQTATVTLVQGPAE